jgi:hypothetical protein
MHQAGMLQLLAGEAGLDYDPVQLYGWGSRINLQCGSHRASLLHVCAKGSRHPRLISRKSVRW